MNAECEAGPPDLLESSRRRPPPGASSCDRGRGRPDLTAKCARSSYFNQGRGRPLSKPLTAPADRLAAKGVGGRPDSTSAVLCGCDEKSVFAGPLSRRLRTVHAPPSSRFTTEWPPNCRMKTARIRIIKHEVVPGCGSFEVRFAGRPSQYFYWDDLPSRRLSPDMLDRATAMDRARTVARAAQE